MEFVKKIKNKIKFDIIFVVLFLSSVFLSSLFSLANIINLNSNFFVGTLDGIQNYYSSINFIQSGNNFEGVIFWNTGLLLNTSGEVKYNGNSIYCSYKIRGIYYNSSRGSRIWPLDTGSLDELVGVDSSYSDLQFSGGLYYGCSGYSKYAVFGQINHFFKGTKYSLVAGVNFGNKTYEENLFFMTSTGFLGSGKIYDTYGGVANIVFSSGNYDKNAPNLSLIYPDNLYSFTGNLIKLERSGVDDFEIKKYTYEVSIDTGFSSILFSGELVNTGVNFNIDDDNTYFWHVEGEDYNSNTFLTNYRKFYVAHGVFVYIPVSEASSDVKQAFIDKFYIESGGYLEGSTGISLENRDDGKICPNIPIKFFSTGKNDSRSMYIVLTGCFYLQDNNLNYFTGILKTPSFVSNDVAFSVINLDKSVTFSIGPKYTLNLKKIDNSDSVARFHIPLKDVNSGDIFDIYISESGEQWNLYKTGIVYGDVGSFYLDFTGTHFTYFSLGSETGNFVINNDDLSTSTSGVTLNMNVSGAVEMRFGNTTGDRDSASWISYETGYSRNIIDNEGTQTVYAEFKNSSGVTGVVKDTIILDKSDPIINFTGVTPYSGYMTSGNVFTGEVFIDESNLSGIIRYFGETGYNKGSDTGFVLTGLLDGKYYYYAVVEDTAGKTASTETRNITIDMTNPYLSFTGETPHNNEILNTDNLEIDILIDTNTFKIFNWYFDGISYNVWDTGVFLWENFDKVTDLGESNTIIKDRSINNFTSTVYNSCTWESDTTKFGNGAYFFNGNYDGDIDYINILSGNDVDKLGNIFSVSIWFMRIGYGLYYHNYNTSAKIITNGCNDNWCFEQNQDPGNIKAGFIKFYYDSGSYVESNLAKVPNIWHNIVGVRDYDSGVVKEYIDGNIVWTGTLGTKNYVTKNLFLGKNIDSNDGGFIGYIDEPRIFSYSLDDTGVFLLYTTNIKKISANYWIFSNFSNSLQERWYLYSGCAYDYADNMGCTETRKVMINKDNNLNIFKDSNVNIVKLGDDILYSLDIKNNEIFTGEIIKVYDTIPSGLDFVSWTSTNLEPINFLTSLNNDGTYLEWSGFNLGSGETGAIYFTAKVNNSFDDIWIVSGAGLSGGHYYLPNSGYIDLGIGSDFNIGTNDFFVSSNIKIDKYPTDFYPIVSRYGAQHSSSNNQGLFKWYVASNKNICLQLRDVDSNSQIFCSSNIINTGIWYRVAVGIDRNENKLKIFINDIVEEVGTTLSSLNAWGDQKANMYIGMYPWYNLKSGTPRFMFSGYIYDTRFYTDFPTTGEINEIKKHNIVLTGLVGMYKMDENGGTTCFDSIKRNTGTIRWEMSFFDNNEYSFHTYLGWTDGNGDNGANTGIYIPRYELNTGYDVLGNKLGKKGYLTNGIRNEVYMETNQGEVKDNNYVIVKYNRNTDIAIDKGFTGQLYSGGLVVFNINYINSGDDQQDDIYVYEYLGTGLSGYNNSGRVVNGTGFYYDIGNLGSGVTGSLIFTAVVVTGQEGGLLITNTVKIEGYYDDINTGNNIYTTGFYTNDTLDPWVYFTGSTPENGYITSGTSFTGYVEVVEKYLKKITWNWNGAEYILGENILSLFYTSSGVKDIVKTQVNGSGRMSINVSGLVLSIEFDNNSLFGSIGNVVGDRTIKNNDGVQSGNIERTGNGKYNGTYILDGTDDFIYGNINASNIDNEITVSFWENNLFCDSSSDCTNAIFSIYTGSNNQKFYLGISNPSGEYVNRLVVGGSDIEGSVTSNDQDFSHNRTNRRYVTVTYKNPTLKIYYNGVLKYSRISSGGTINGAISDKFKIGRRMQNGNYLDVFLTNKIDDLRVYNYALSSGQIVQIYNTTVVKYSTGLWGLDVIQTGLVDGKYTYKACAEDKVLHTGCTESRDYYVQTPKIVKFKTATPYTNTGDFWLFEKTGFESWRQVFNSAKIVGDNSILVNYSNSFSTGLVTIGNEIFPNSGNEYLAVFKLTGALSVGYTGIWNNNITGFDFSSGIYENIYPKLIYDGYNYLIPGDLVFDSIGSYDLIWGNDFTLLNTKLTNDFSSVSDIFDFDDNNVVSSIEQGNIIDFLGSGGYIQDDLPSGLTILDFVSF